MRRAGVLAVVSLLLLVGCGNSTSGGDYVSRYEPVADAPTLRELKRELLEDIDPRVRTLKVIDEHPHEGMGLRQPAQPPEPHRVVARHVADDGTWTAREWLQCID